MPLKMRDKIASLDVYPTYHYGRFRDYIIMTKPRLLFSVVFSAALGYCLPVNGSIDFFPLFFLLLGTALTGAGAHVLNQWLEIIPDSKMTRTQNRPLPAGRVSGEEALVFGLIISFMGVSILWVGTNLVTAMLGLTTLCTYVLIYTPLKQRSILNTWFGGITGALPPVMGWTASTGQIEFEVLPVFALLYFWQMPHFFAIAWMYREDYIKGEFRMLSMEDEKGRRTSFQMLFNGILLLISSVAIYLSGQGSMIYLVSAILLGSGFLGVMTLFVRQSSVSNARKVFLASIMYLPVLSTVLVLDRIF